MAHMQVSSGKHAEWPSFLRDDQHALLLGPVWRLRYSPTRLLLSLALESRQALTGA
jgi:hypothetical protein